MANVLVPIADGSEEIEAVTIIDVLVRAGAEVTVASVMEHSQIIASRGVKLDGSCLIGSCGRDWDLIALPGGLPGADHLAQSGPLMELVRQQLAQQRLLAAICAAPAVVLGRHGLLADRVATCYPGFQEELASQARAVSVERVVEDENLITSQGPGTAMEFSLALVTRLFGSEKAAAVADGLLSR